MTDSIFWPSRQPGSAARTKRNIGVRMLIMAVLLGAGAWPCHGEEPAASPQRPSVSFSTVTVPDRIWELEAGGLVTTDASSIPLFLKYGLTDRTELEFGLDAVRQVEQADGVLSSIGELFLGVRSRRSLRDGRSAAVVGWLRVPAAVEGVGTSYYDAGAVGVLSLPLGDLTLDLNLWWSGLGRGGGSAVGQVMALGYLGIPLNDTWSSYVEVVEQHTAGGEGSGGFIDAGIAHAATRTTVFDAAIGAGWDNGFPDWSVTVGWTILFERE